MLLLVTYFTAVPAPIHAAPEVGCIIDGRHGWHAHVAMIREAVAYGYSLTLVDIVACLVYESDVESDVDSPDGVDWLLNQGGIMDAAEAWLNESVARPGHYFGWEDGDFGYWASYDVFETYAGVNVTMEHIGDYTSDYRPVHAFLLDISLGGIPWATYAEAIKGGCNSEPNVPEAMGSLASFLGAWVESHPDPESDNAELFPDALWELADWQAVADEMSADYGEVDA